MQGLAKMDTKCYW